jgi:hypothetical protein
MLYLNVGFEFNAVPCRRGAARAPQPDNILVRGDSLTRRLSIMLS